MARKESSYPLHPDYQRAPSINFNFHPLLVDLFNLFFAVQRWVSARKAGEGVSRETLKLGLVGREVKSHLIKPLGADGPLPLLLYYHGGAFALSYAASHLRSCEELARRCGCAVLLVDYRLAPRHKFPQGFDDCYDSLQWSIDNAAAQGFDTSRIAVGGDSAGGALAAGVAQKALDNGVKLVGQLLVYPVLDNACATPSAVEFADTPIWNVQSNRSMWEMYLPGGNSDAPPAYAAPAGRENLQNLPAAFVDTAEYDPLRDEALDYASRLEQAGVPLSLRQTRGTIHGYDATFFNEIVAESVDLRVEFLNHIFAS